MPRLLQINSTANWGSTGKIAEQIGERAIAHGWESYIAYGRAANNSSSTLIRIGSLLSQAWHLMQTRLFDRHGRGSKYATKELIRRIEELKPDIIHLHNIHGYYINYPILFKYLNSTNIPVVWTLHDCWAFTGHCAHYMNCGCTKWQQECNNCPNKKVYPKALIDNSKYNYRHKQQLFTSRANRLIITPVSQWLADQVRSSFLANSHINHIYNGIDTDVFSFIGTNSVRKRYSIEAQYIIVAVASVWDENKGLHDILSLCTILPTGYTIIVVGLNNRQTKDLPGNVVAIPRTNSQEELAEIYSCADVVLSTSHQETFGLTIAEGMACGVPAIVYNTTALPELITPDTGIVVEQGDIKGIAQAIETICAKGKGHFTQACRRRAVENFDKIRCFEKYIALYDDLLAKKL